MITINASPQKFTPAYNPVVFRISSDNYAQPDFKFVADVYNGAKLLGTFKYQPQVLGSTPIEIDIHDVLRQLVAPDYCRLNDTVSPSIVTAAGAGIAAYQVQFGEQYGGTVHANLINWSGYVFNGGMNTYRFAFYDQAAYLNEQFLAYQQRQTVRREDSAMLSILQSDTAAITGFGLNIFDAAGGSLYSTTISNPLNSLSAVGNRMLHLHVGFDYLNARLAFGAGVYSLAAYYTITPTGGAPFRFDINTDCARFPGRRLFFLNELGGFDAFSFMLTDRRTDVSDKKTYERQPVNKATAYDAAARRFEATGRVYAGTYRERARLGSDYLTDAETNLLRELFSSPLIYMQASAAEYGGAHQQILIPVKSTLNEYQVKQTRLDKLYTVEADVELVHMSWRQNS